MGLLGRARSMMQGWSASTPSRPQPFSVSCAQGHRLQGHRTEGYQALRCPTCGEGIFVLPRSPLPEPPVPASSRRSMMAEPVEAEGFSEDGPLPLTDPFPSTATAVEGDEPEAEIDWVDEVPPEPGPEPVPEPKKRTEPARKPARPAAPPTAGQRDAPRPKPKPPGPVVMVAPSPTLAEWALMHRNALLFAGLVVLIVGTVAIRRHRMRLEELPRIAEIGRTEGLKKLDAGEFHAAKKLLADAADAVNGLGGRFEGAESIRQGALEAAIFADLAPKGIDEILEEAATSEAKDWPSHFATMYKGRSVILDPPVIEAPEAGKPNSRYQVGYPLYFGRGPRPEKGRLDLTGFRLFELSQPKVGEQKPFGARFASVELDLTTNEWVVTFEPDSGAYITHAKALEAIDWAPADPSEEPAP